MMKTATMWKGLELLDTKVNLDFSVDDLRMILNCFRAVEYQMKLDDEPYLDADAFARKNRLENEYRSSLTRLGVYSAS